MPQLVKLAKVSHETKGMQPYGRFDGTSGCYTFNGISIVSRDSPLPTFLGEVPQPC